MVHSNSWQGGAGFCQVASVPLCAGFSKGLLKCIINMKGDFHQRQMQERESQAEAIPFGDLASHILSYFCYIL